MPIIQSAKKKMRKDRKKTNRNNRYKSAYKRLSRALLKGKKSEDRQGLIAKVYSALDKAVKRRVIHKNKAARLKSLFGSLIKKQ